MPEAIKRVRRGQVKATGERSEPVPILTGMTQDERLDNEARGGRLTTVAEFVGLSEPRMRAIDLRIGLTEAIIRLRGEAKMTQAALARKLGLSRPRIAEIEARKPSTSFDNLIPAFFAVGGTSEEFAQLVKRTDESMSY